MDQQMDQTHLSWNATLLDQLTWHWTNQVRPRLEGLTDDEYLWEPTPDCWSVRPRGTSSTPMAAGSGDMTIDFALPQEGVPEPVTTIAWRLCHVIVGVFAVRNANHFGRDQTDYFAYDYPATAAEALRQLDDEYARWIAGVESLGEAGLSRPCGPSEGPFADSSMARLVLHINREVIHHLAEVSLLRDLYAHRG